MIEKFNLNESCSTSIDGIHWVQHPNIEDILEKINEIIDIVNTFELKHGRWIDLDGAWKCSNCGEISCCCGDYCPDCGAKMDGERKEDGKID